MQVIQESKEREKEKIINHLKYRLKVFDTITGIITFTIIILYTIEFEWFITKMKESDGTVTKDQHQSTIINHILRTVILLLSIVVCVLIYIHYKVNLRLKKYLGVTFNLATLRTSGDWKYMIGEMVLNLLVCPPFMDGSIKGSQDGGGLYNFSYDGIIYSISLTRIYLIFRLYEQYSRWTNKKARKIW